VGKILICPYIDVFDKHLPLYDRDNDGFTDVVGFRGERDGEGVIAIIEINLYILDISLTKIPTI
jgi:hypothetical protein